MKAWENNIRKVEPYVPGEQPKDSGVIKLNTNENPYPPAPEVRKAVESTDIDKLRLYPDPDVTELVSAIADYYGMEKNQVFVGVGSDDVLSMCFLTFFNGSKPVLFPNISYSFYSVWADLYRIPYEKQALDKEFNITASDYYKENGGVIFPNPNAPTGLYMGLDTVRDIIEHNRDVVVIVDEAYIDECVDKIITTREKAKKSLSELGFTFPDSKANFIFATHKSVPAKEIFEKLKEKKIFVRYFNQPGIDNYLRITVGTDEQMDKLMEALSEIVG